MKPIEREDKLYKNGKRCKIDMEERVLLQLLDELDSKAYYLDIGCGTGEAALIAAGKGFKVFCSDFSSQALKIARKENGLNCVLSDLDSGLPFADATFDVVWAADVLEHLFDPIFGIGEISRVLKKGGSFLTVIPNDLYISNRIRILCGISYQQRSYMKFSQYKHHTFFSHGLLKYMLEKNSLKIEKRINICKLPKIKTLVRVSGSGAIMDLFSTVLIYKIVRT
ncbi:class I SAM-dependent methyltransferase [Candidatus Omnitrophota bacterium]